MPSTFDLFVEFTLYARLTCSRCKQQYTLALLPQPETKTILIVFDVKCSQSSSHFRDICDAKPMPLFYRRFTYGGECIDGSPLPSMTGLPDPRVRLVDQIFIPVDRSGTFHLATLSAEKYSYVFDEQSNRFTLVKSLFKDMMTAGWKDTFYGSRFEVQDNEYNVVALANLGTRYVSTLFVHSSHVWLSLTKTSCRPAYTPVASGLLEDHAYVSNSVLSISLNEKYLVCRVDDAFYILCFQDSENRPKQDGPFFNGGTLKVLQGHRTWTPA